MEIIISKSEFNKAEYQAGDILTLGNPYRKLQYLLISGNGDEVGAVNLKTNYLEYYYPKARGFNSIVFDILKSEFWDEWAVVKSQKASLTLNLEDSIVTQVNNSGSF